MEYFLQPQMDKQRAVLLLAQLFDGITLGTSSRPGQLLSGLLFAQKCAHRQSAALASSQPQGTRPVRRHYSLLALAGGPGTRRLSALGKDTKKNWQSQEVTSDFPVPLSELLIASHLSLCCSTWTFVCPLALAILGTHLAIF